MLEEGAAGRFILLNRKNLRMFVESRGLKAQERESFFYYSTSVLCICHRNCYCAVVYLHLNYLQKYRKV